MTLRLFANAVEKFRNRHIVFAHAGATAALARKTSFATCEQVLRTNLTGVSFALQAAPETEQQVPRRQS
jgi:hypothetical protein